MNHYINPGKFLTELFPEQTKTPLRIIIWTVIFILDLAAMYFLLDLVGIHWLHPQYPSLQRYYLFFLIGGGFSIFWIETFIYNKLHALFR